MSGENRICVKRSSANERVLCFALLTMCLPSPPDLYAVPEAPADLVATVLSASLIELDWTQNGNGVVGFKIEGATNSGGPWVQIADISLNTAVYRNPQLVRGVTYYYRVRTYNAQGISAYSNVASTPPLCPPSVVGWGNNGSGQVSPPSNLSNAVAIAAGWLHSLALRNDGVVVGWGNNGSGQATPPSGLTKVVAIAAGFSHSLAARSNGVVVGWGNNNYGQASPPVIATNVVTVAAGYQHSLALTMAGTVLGWGGNSYGQASPPISVTNAVAIAAGFSHSLALLSDGTVVGWGNNSSGQASPPAGLTGVVAIAAGSYYSLALTSDGTVVGWGDNSYGQSSPPPSATNVVAIAAGYYHSLALTSDGSVVEWGNNGSGQATPPGDLTGVVAIAAGGSHSLALTCDPAAPSALLASAVSSTQINLSWTDNSGNEAGFKVERATASGGPWTQIGTTGAGVTTYADTGVSPSTTYYYRVRATNSAGDSAYSAVASAVTPAPPDTTGPSPPTGLTATAVSIAQINLTWNASTDAGGSGLAGYKVYRGVVQIAAVTGTSFTNTSLSPGTQYCYAVAAYDNAGNMSAQSAQSCATTKVLVTVPAAPSVLTATVVSANQINLSWTDNSGNEAGFKVERATASGGPWTQIGTTGTGVTTYADTGVSPSTTYYYRVRATNSTGDSGYSVVASATTPALTDATPPSQPTGLTATAVSVAQINLTWNASTDAGGSGLAGYKVYRGGIQITTVSSTGFTNTSLSPGTQYCYAVAAFDNAGNTSAQSAQSCATTTMLVTVPAAPSGLTATAAANDEIDLSWTDNSTNETGFEIERSTDGSNFVQIAQVPSKAEAYQDTGIVGGTTYYYRVRAYNSAGDSGYSNVAFTASPIVGRIIGWGNDVYGQTLAPTNLTGVVAISLGSSFSVALTSDGNVVSWGNDSYDQATPPDNLTQVTAVAAGYHHSLALRSDGTVVGWGNNTYGQATPPTNLTGVVAITAGYYHSLALKSDGTVIGWGNDNYGQATVPTNLTGVVAIAAGYYHSLALKSDGTVVAWGNNAYGQGTPPTNLTGVVAVTAGWGHSLALRSNGAVVGWGNNAYSQAAPPANLSGVVGIVAGWRHSLALKGDGTVVGWGNNTYGQATPPTNLTGVVAIAAGYYVSLAIVGP